MEGLQKAFRSAISEEPKVVSMNKSTFPSSSYSDQSRYLVTRPPRQSVSLWTCSKLCAIFFVAGMVVGFTLKRRVRRWASRILRRLKDD